jgi:hypothetical protein
MPKKPKTTTERLFHHPTRTTLVQVMAPLLAFGHCELPAYIRQSLERALSSSQLPDPGRCSLGKNHQRSNEEIEAIITEEHRNQAALVAATKLKNARVLFEQGTQSIEEVCPVLFYYGAISFLDFVTSCVIRRARSQDSNRGHGLSVICGDDGWKFDKNWPRNRCSVEMKPFGDFPFYVDALTIAGWPSLFSGFRLHQDLKTSPWQAIENPAPLLKDDKFSLDQLCNFDLEVYVQASPGLDTWLKGAGKDLVWKVTTFLLDVVIVYIASSLSRYYVPAWRAVVDGQKSQVYGDIKIAFETIAEHMPFFFSGEHPFQYSFQTQIGS